MPERPLRNPASIAAGQQVPTEQEVYATASLWRAKARSDGKVTRELLSQIVTGDPMVSAGDGGGLVESSILGYRRST